MSAPAPAVLKFPAKPLSRRRHVPEHTEGRVVITKVPTGKVVSIAVVRSFHFDDDAEAEQFARRFR